MTPRCAMTASPWRRCSTRVMALHLLQGEAVIAQRGVIVGFRNALANPESHMPEGLRASVETEVCCLRFAPLSPERMTGTRWLHTVHYRQGRKDGSARACDCVMNQSYPCCVPDAPCHALFGSQCHGLDPAVAEQMSESLDSARNIVAPSSRVYRRYSPAPGRPGFPRGGIQLFMIPAE